MPRILVVDDEQDLAWAVQQSLQNAGYAVTVAHDGAAAIACAQRDLPDLVILDVLMPTLDGFQVCQWLRGNPALTTVPGPVPHSEERHRGPAAGPGRRGG